MAGETLQIQTPDGAFSAYVAKPAQTPGSIRQKRSGQTAR